MESSCLEFETKKFRSLPSVILYVYIFLMNKKRGGGDYGDYPLGVTIGALMLENVKLSHSYCGWR